MNSAALRSRFLCIGFLLTTSCVPELDDDPSLALDGQIIALRFEPAEAEPETTTLVSALVASEETASASEVAYSLCVARKPLSELGPVHPACLGPTKNNDALVPLGEGLGVEVAVPKDACSLFGPQRPPAEPGQPPGRPVDPDATGGFYQPVIAKLHDAVLGSLRLDCGLPGGSQAQVAQYNREHEPNQNPSAKSVEIRVGQGEWQTVPLDGASAVPVSRNETITVRSQWSAAERYFFLTPDTRQLTRRNETPIATFYSTIGGFDEHRVEVDDKGRVSSRFQTTDERGQVRVWIVVRDGRSGAGWTSFKVDVR